MELELKGEALKKADIKIANTTTGDAKLSAMERFRKVTNTVVFSSKLRVDKE